MVFVFTKRGNEYFGCEVCDMIFKKRRQAEHCETRCKKGIKCQRKMIRRCVHF
jgi:uncharacterized C2H2 Zn-finger protein